MIGSKINLNLDKTRGAGEGDDAACRIFQVSQKIIVQGKAIRKNMVGSHTQMLSSDGVSLEEICEYSFQLLG